ncbi:uncharacterized protein LOC122093242 [Macadamia integrifolia]|uniref:uncharacterized protein LOC122093242 n=1 Tax=Macadamia integrifolia TaxID=60698 RepID=UPI001C529AF7|nr:uncharacterized protein LOC122093242 [Macadamia integrifolia]
MSPPITNNNSNNPNKPYHHHHFLQKPTSLPDIFFTALSLLFLFSSSKPQHNHLSPKILPFSFPSNPRRLFLKNSIMSQSKRTSPNHFSTPQSLSDWLRPRLPSDSFASWGVKPGTKNVHNLWLEIAEGETSLIDSSPPLRTVHVVTVRVIDGHGSVLLESHQELSDGSLRERCRPLSEKMKPGESVEDAVRRAVREELGSIIQGSLDDELVRIVPGSYLKKEEERLSVSYPGLPAYYVLHSVDAWVDGLPEGEFFTEEDEEYRDCSEAEAVANKAVFVKRHFWKWATSDPV